MYNIRIIALIILSSVSFSMYAQKHLTFMGVPMGQNINTFTEKLIEQGLTIYNSGSHLFGNEEDEDWVTLSGPFWYFDSTDNILVKAPYIDKGVSSVLVMARANHQTYQKLISTLNTKYGKHQRSINVQFKGDAQYIWITSKGNIEVWRSAFAEDDAQCNVEITYKDYPLVNRTAKKKSKRSNDL